jgi:hypothetical protein
MIVETMNFVEIIQEIQTDYPQVTLSFERLANEYHKERKRMGIKKEKIFSRCYALKPKSKNPWLIYLSKAPAVNSYKSIDDINLLALTYMFQQRGLRVFQPGSTGGLYIYNGHLFQRYNERMDLGINSSLDIVKHFFAENGYSTSKIIQKEGKELLLTSCRDGLLLGELLPGRKIIIQKTFISRELAGNNQDIIENDLINSLRREIELEINGEIFDPATYNFKADIITNINSGTD